MMINHNKNTLILGPKSSGKSSLSFIMTKNIINSENIKENKVVVIVKDANNDTFWNSNMPSCRLFDTKRDIILLSKLIKKIVNKKNNGDECGSVLIIDDCSHQMDQLCINTLLNDYQISRPDRYLITTSCVASHISPHSDIFDDVFLFKNVFSSAPYVYYEKFINKNNLSFTSFNQIYCSATSGCYTALRVTNTDNNQTYSYFPGLELNTVKTLTSKINSALKMKINKLKVLNSKLGSIINLKEIFTTMLGNKNDKAIVPFNHTAISKHYVPKQHKIYPIPVSPIAYKPKSIGKYIYNMIESDGEPRYHETPIKRTSDICIVSDTMSIDDIRQRDGVCLLVI